jgi:hypothetical protein
MMLLRGQLQLREDLLPAEEPYDGRLSRTVP